MVQAFLREWEEGRVCHHLQQVEPRRVVRYLLLRGVLHRLLLEAVRLLLRGADRRLPEQPPRENGSNHAVG